MANKLPSRDDLFKTFDSVENAPDYSKAVGSLMLENQKTSSRLKRWSLLFLIILLLLAALAAAAFQSLYQNYRSDQIVAEIKKDPLGEIKVSSSDIAADSIDFNQLNSALRAKIVNIDNSVTNISGQVASVNETIDKQPPDAGGTVTNVSTGAGLTGGPITGTGLIAVRAPTCTSNQRLSWDGANFRCVGVLGTGTVGANTFFAGPTSGSGAPSYRTIVAGDLSGALSSTGPVIYNDTTGDISCPTCITSVGTAFVASADSGSDQPLNIGDTLSLLGGDGISTVASIGNEVTFNLTDTGITPATYGSASSVPTFTVDSKGRLTSASSTAIAINASAITSGTLSVTRGGTGVNGSAATNGQLLIGNGSGYSLSTLTGSGPVGITNSAGGITIDCSTCVTTSGNGNITSTGGDITLGGTTTGRLIGSGNVNYDLSTTGVVGATYGSASQVGVFTVDSKGRLTGASNTTISGLTTSNLSGTAGITNAQLQNSALTISSGNGLSGGGSISLGGSSSLAISAPTCLANERLSWNGSAFICSTVAAGGSEAANTFFAGPTSGGAAAPAFRGIVTADLGSGTANNQSFLRGDQTWFQLLDAGGKIDPSLLPSSGLNLQGSWDADTNSPTLSDGGTGGVQGDFYIVNTAGTTSVDGENTWNVGDWILHNGSTWERISNTNAVSSVNGSIGAVILDTDDVSEGAGNLYFTNARARGAISGSGPISYNNGTGVIDCPTCVTTSGNGDIVVGTGASISGTLTGRLIGAGNVTFGVSSDVPTSVVNDTNVTGSISANALTLGWTGQLSASRGGTGVDGSGATNGQLLIGNGSGYSLSTLSSSGPIGITNSAGGIAIGCSTCVTTGTTLFTAAGDLGVNQSVTSGQTVTFVGGVGLTTTGSATRNITIDLDDTAVTAGTYGSASSVASFTVDAQGRITNASSTAIALNASAITAGTLSVSRGGTGVDGSGATNGQLLIGNGSGYSLASITAGSGISVTNGAGSITIANTGAAATCSVSSSYACNGGNTLGGSLTLGTNDTNSVVFETNNATRFTLSSGAATLTGSGATTLTSSGTMTLNSATASTLNVDSGTTGAVNIGTSANAKTITIGNTTGSTGVIINSGSGNINFQPGGTGTTANVQIGAGGAGSTTPDLFVLDSKSSAGDPTGTNGAMYYNASSGKFRCYENGTWKDCIGGGAAINLGHAASYAPNQNLQNVSSSQVTLGTVSVTPSSITGDVYVTGQADVYSSNNTDQTFVLTIETGSTCTGTTVATRSYEITSNSSSTVDRGSLIVSGIASDPGASSQNYSLCASTATGDTDVLNWRIEAMVVDSSGSGNTGNPSADSVTDTSVSSPTPGTNPTFGTEVEILNPTNPTITPDTSSQRVHITGGVQFAGAVGTDDTDTTLRVRVRRGSGSCAGTQVGPDITAAMTDPLQSIWVPFSVVDSPATTSAQAYTVCASTRDSDGSSGTNATTPTVMMTIQEVAASGADLAETYYTHDDAEPGDLVSIDSSMKAGVRKSNKAYDPLVLGVVSTKPGFILSDPEGTDPSARSVDLALSGRVPVKVSDENGQVKVGDPLAPSSIPGVAMKASETGWVIGVAMEDQTSSKATVLTYVNRSWYSGGESKIPSLTGLSMTDGNLAGIEKEQLNQMQDGLSSNNPELVSQALGILKDIQGTVVGQQTKFNELEAKLNSQQVAQAVFNGGVVTEDSTFEGKVVFEALTTFNSGIVFNGDASFAGNVSFDRVISQSKDQAGVAIIPAGLTSVQVVFSAGAYDKPPIVTATPVGEDALLDFKYSVANVSENGFTIFMKPEQTQDIKFNYIVAQTQ